MLKGPVWVPKLVEEERRMRMVEDGNGRKRGEGGMEWGRWLAADWVRGLRTREEDREERRREQTKKTGG